MLRRILPLFAGLAVLGLFAITLAFLAWKSVEPPVVHETEAPFVTNIVLKTVATGAIVPRNEVAIKSRVSGVVSQLAVEPGQLVSRGDLIASIQIIPDMVTLNNAQSQVRAAKISMDDSQDELDRAETLFQQNAISTAEVQRARVAHSLRNQEHQAALFSLLQNNFPFLFASKHQQFVHNDFCDVFLIAIFVIITSGSQFSFNGDFFPFF